MPGATNVVPIQDHLSARIGFSEVRVRDLYVLANPDVPYLPAVLQRDALDPLALLNFRKGN